MSTGESIESVTASLKETMADGEHSPTSWGYTQSIHQQKNPLNLQTKHQGSGGNLDFIFRALNKCPLFKSVSMRAIFNNTAYSLTVMAKTPAQSCEISATHWDILE